MTFGIVMYADMNQPCGMEILINTKPITLTLEKKPDIIRIQLLIKKNKGAGKPSGCRIRNAEETAVV